MSAPDIDHYFLVGGSCALPRVKEALAELFDGRPAAPLQGKYGSIDTTLAVSRGAAVYDMDRADEVERSTELPNVPSRPILERKLPYSVGLLVADRQDHEILVPEGAVLPYGPVEKEFAVRDDGDESVSIELVRVDGAVVAATRFAPQTVWFDRPQRRQTRFKIAWYVDETAELTVKASDAAGEELGVVRAVCVEDN
jgi:molecular chaperone DnaK (HSP70)